MAALLFLFVTAAASVLVTVTTDYTESTFFFSMSHAPWVILGLILVIWALSTHAVRKVLDRINGKIMLIVLMVYSFGASVAWILIANVDPGFDSRNLMDASYYLSGADIGADEWLPLGSYMERYPFQASFVGLLYLCVLIGGTHAAWVYEFINCLAVPFIFLFCVKFSQVAFENARADKYCMVICFLFCPLILYCTFVYGNTLALMFSMMAFYFQARALKERRYGLLCLAFGLAIIGILVKSSMLLVLVAMAFITFFMAFQHRTFWYVLILVCAIGANSLAGTLVTTAMENASGVDLHNGLPNSAWVVMGLGADTQTTDTQKPGWYSAYVWSRVGEDYNPEVYSEESGQLIKERLAFFAQNPGFAVEFFGKKYLYEWAEPTYESIMMSNWAVAEAGGVPMASRELTPIAHSMYYGILNRVTIWLCDFLQSGMLVAVLAFFLLTLGNPKLEHYAPILYAAGGALFYLAWEAKSQYILPFYVAMIPYTGIGITLFTDRIRTWWDQRNASPQVNRRKAPPRHGAA